MKYIKYYLLLGIILISLFNSTFFAYTIEGHKDPRLHKSYYIAIYEATSKSGFNCTTSNWNTGDSSLAYTSVNHIIGDGEYNIHIPYKLPFYKDFSIACGFELARIELVIRHPGEPDYMSDNNDRRILILENYHLHDNESFKAGWNYEVKNSKKYFKIPPKTQLFCYTKSHKVLDGAQATDKEREMFALGDKTENPISSELLCALNAPKREYTYHYTIQNKEKVVAYITHPDIGTNTINQNESFHIDLLVDEAQCFLHLGWYDSNDKVPDKFREMY